MARGAAKKSESQEEKTLYQILGVEKDASQQEIKKAYHKLALRSHPDKNPDDKDAKENFQKLQAVFHILGDPDKRSIYDRTGRVDDAELGGENFNNLYEYYRDMYNRVTVEDIQRFEEEYRGSEEEASHVQEYYERFSGNMNKVFAFVMCSDSDKDSHRFRDILAAAIKEGKVVEFPKYRKWAKSVDSMPRPEDVPTTGAGPSGSGSSKRKKGEMEAGEGAQDLFAMIRSRQAERSSALFDSLEAKYAKPKGGSKRKGKGKKDVGGVPEEPSEEEFQAMQEAIMRRAGKTGKENKR